MTVLHKYSPNTFFSLIEKLDAIALDTLFQFPIEYYEDDTGITLYKFVSGLTMCTKLIFSYDSTQDYKYIMFNGDKYSYDQFIQYLVKNHNAILLLNSLEEQESSNGED